MSDDRQSAMWRAFYADMIAVLDIEAEIERDRARVELIEYQKYREKRERQRENQRRWRAKQRAKMANWREQIARKRAAKQQHDETEQRRKAALDDWLKQTIASVRGRKSLPKLF